MMSVILMDSRHSHWESSKEASTENDNTMSVIEMIITAVVPETRMLLC